MLRFVLVSLLLLVIIVSGDNPPENPSKAGEKHTDKMPRRNATCKTKSKTIRVKPGLPETPLADICWFCSKTKCGEEATEIFLDNPQTCVAHEIKNCCPNIISIEQDNQGLCDCFCREIPHVRGTGNKIFNACPGTCGVKAPLALRGLPPSAPSSSSGSGVNVVVSISITGIIMIVLVLGGCWWYRRKNHMTFFSAQQFANGFRPVPQYRRDVTTKQARLGAVTPDPEQGAHSAAAGSNDDLLSISGASDKSNDPLVDLESSNGRALN